jgi:hypothetical protein
MHCAEETHGILVAAIGSAFRGHKNVCGNFVNVACWHSKERRSASSQKQRKRLNNCLKVIFAHGRTHALDVSVCGE